MKPAQVLFLLLSIGFLIPLSAQNRLLISKRSPGGILQHDLQSGQTQELVEGNLNQCLAITVDSVRRKIYWTENPVSGPAIIERSDLDGTNRATLPINNLVLLTDITVDYMHQKLLWVDNGAQKIMRSNLDGTNVETVTAAKGPIGVAINCTFNKIYWTEDRPNSSIGKIMRMELDGSQQEEIASYDGTPAKIAIDCYEDKILWSDDLLKQIKISDPGGLNVSTLLQFSGSRHPYSIVTDQKAGIFYWTDYTYDVVSSFTYDSGLIQDVLTEKNMFGLARYTFTPVAAPEAEKNPLGLQLTPNPVYRNLRVLLNDQVRQATGFLSSADGQIRSVRTLQSGANEFDLSGLPAGLYILRVQQQNAVSTARFVKM